MKRNTILKIMVDIGMTIVLLFLMTYELIGDVVHEWLGIGMFGLFISHHILNRKWSRSIFKGKYTLLRSWQTFLVMGILLTMLGSMYSGMILSEYALSFLPMKGDRAFARILHMASAYWGFILMSLHIGLHWNMVMGLTKRFVKELPTAGKWVIRGTATFAAGYGAYAFVRREFGRYMFLESHFVFFDFEEPLLFFLIDYMAVIFLFTWIGHYLSKGLRYYIQKKKSYIKR